MCGGLDQTELSATSKAAETVGVYKYTQHIKKFENDSLKERDENVESEAGNKGVVKMGGSRVELEWEGGGEARMVSKSKW